METNRLYDNVGQLFLDIVSQCNLSFECSYREVLKTLYDHGYMSAEFKTTDGRYGAIKLTEDDNVVVGNYYDLILYPLDELELEEC